MSTNEKKFRKTVKEFAVRRNGIDCKFYVKENKDGRKELVAKIPLRDDWTKMFHFDGVDTVSIKNRLSDGWSDMCSIEAFEIAYGGVA